MPSKPRDRTGEIYGKLTVIGISKRRTSAGNTFWWCLCECGKKREVASYSLSHKIRKKKNVTECKACAKTLSIQGVCKKNDREEKDRRESAQAKRLKLIGKVPKEWLELAMTDAHARELGQKHFFRGIKCLNGHLSPYRINGGCLACSKEKETFR